MLSALDLPVCVASSSPAGRLRSKLAQTQLLEHFDPYVYSTERVANGKPYPDLFLLAANEMGCDPIRCIVVEDSLNGVVAGRRAGMHVVGFTAGSHCPPQHAEKLLEHGASQIAASYAELAGQIAQLRDREQV
jgi:beta-phosphoglucomutase-like phosphatase (HAD superfamily)